MGLIWTSSWCQSSVYATCFMCPGLAPYALCSVCPRLAPHATCSTPALLPAPCHVLHTMYSSQPWDKHRLHAVHRAGPRPTSNTECQMIGIHKLHLWHPYLKHWLIITSIATNAKEVPLKIIKKSYDCKREWSEDHLKDLKTACKQKWTYLKRKSWTQK